MGRSCWLELDFSDRNAVRQNMHSVRAHILTYRRRTCKAGASACAKYVNRRLLGLGWRVCLNCCIDLVRVLGHRRTQTIDVMLITGLCERSRPSLRMVCAPFIPTCLIPQLLLPALHCTHTHTHTHTYDLHRHATKPHQCQLVHPTYSTISVAVSLWMSRGMKSTT